MTLQINPVLAGTYDTPDYPASSNNIASAQTDDTDAVDQRRYTKFDHSATEAGTMTNFSFGDFLDMINPLQHIPVVSSVYREIVGDTINPVARVVGDTIYGGAMGIASGIIGALGAAGDSVIEQVSGKDAAGTVVASLFGSDDKTAPTASPAIQLAQAETTAPAADPSSASSQVAAQTSAQTSAQVNARAKLMASAVAAAAASAVQASMPSTGTSSPAAQMASASSAAGSGLLGQLAGNSGTTGFPINGTKTFALPPRNLPYGGVMAPPLQGNNMAIALAQAAPGLQMNHTVYTGRTFNSGIKFQPATSTSPAPAPTATASAATPTPAAAASTAPLSLPAAPPDASAGAYVSTAAPDQLPPSLMSDIAALRAINAYRSTAGQNSSSGPGVNTIN
jgi:hypothetical protein